MSSDRIQRLNSIGIIWDLRNQSIGFSLKVKNRFDELCAFKAQNGHCNVSTLDAHTKSLGKWVSRQRGFYKRNTLSSNHIQQLNSVGFIWDLLEQAKRVLQEEYLELKPHTATQFRRLYLGSP
uniref:Helicase-associated domain-containing protein n=1 Tax=Ditylum brightwellii TaxID=49249 RepID=A0A7S4RNP4_9STRA